MSNNCEHEFTELENEVIRCLECGIGMCANNRCKEGYDENQKLFKAIKPHAKYCSRECGNRTRQREFYYNKKQNLSE